uniref:NB-ARC domain-containing protein n=1 Tax=Leersia perrieri TaxID=77586 RepID=A0A0D9WUX5_9ORYZ
MEAFLSAVLSDLASRSISFLINKCSKQAIPIVLERLQQLLLRARITVEEADDRLITNQTMLQQLNILRKEMYSGYYILDNFRCHGHEEDNCKDQVSNSSAQSKFNPAKRARFCMVSGQSLQEQLHQVIGSLEVTLEDISEFIMFLSNCPRLCHQPYSMHLILDKCMFSRQMEMECIMNFLLKEDTSDVENPGVLPVIGPGRVGKTTLIEHACNDQRVRNNFCQIVFFSGDNLDDANLVTLRDSGVIKHQNHATGVERILIIIELTKEIDEGVWRRLYSASRNHVASSGKIIVTSRSENIASFGTTPALRIKFFSQEAYWYFFKVRTFGSMDAKDHPILASVAMEVARELNECLMGANIYSALLKTNFNVQFWRRALVRIREFVKLNVLLYGASFFDDPWQATGPSYIRRVNKIKSEYVVMLDNYQTCSAPNMVLCRSNNVHSEDELPMMSMQELLFGSVRPQGKFKVLAVRSHLPPCFTKPLLPPPTPPLSMEEKIQRLKRMLLRLAALVEEADGRRITNHSMLHQVNMLRQDMHRGYYVLDTFRFKKSYEEEMNEYDDDKVSSNTLTLSKFKPRKRARLPTGTSQHGDKGGELEQVLDKLGVAMADMVEFVLLLNNYPSMYRQPYNTYMFMDKCMFGRQMEMEHVINFLLHASFDNLGVLPIIGPDKVGKSTLVEHVCYDERVRKHFSCIIFLTDSDFREEKSLLNLSNGGAIRYKHNSSSSTSSGGRMLVIVELVEDVDNDKWRRLYSSSRSCISAGSKIIITSTSEKIAKLGTTQPLHLKFLPREAYWYFFKVLVFGSSNPEEHPEVASASINMFNDYFDHEMYKEFMGQFIDLRNMADIIQASLHEGSFHNLCQRIRLLFCGQVMAKEMNQSMLSRGSGVSGLQSMFLFIPRIDEDVHYYCDIYNHCPVGFAHEKEEEEAPQIDIKEVVSGRVAPHGKFNLVVWRSHLPPYYNYIYSSEIHDRARPAVEQQKKPMLTVGGAA